jgi:hypothetical protein
MESGEEEKVPKSSGQWSVASGQQQAMRVSELDLAGTAH